MILPSSMQTRWSALITFGNSALTLSRPSLKESYWTYYEKALKLLRPGGTIAFDNTLKRGAVADPERDEEVVVAAREFNERLAGDADRSDVLLLNIEDGKGDGYTLCVKK